MKLTNGVQYSLFSYRYLKDENSNEYINSKAVVVKEERQYFFDRISDDKDQYHIYRIAYDIYFEKAKDTGRYSFYGFITSKNKSPYLQQANLLIRKAKIEQILDG
jgi:hypothetical protein